MERERPIQLEVSREKQEKINEALYDLYHYQNEYGIIQHNLNRFKRTGQEKYWDAIKDQPRTVRKFFEDINQKYIESITDPDRKISDLQYIARRVTNLDEIPEEVTYIDQIALKIREAITKKDIHTIEELIREAGEYIATVNKLKGTRHLNR